MVTDLAGVRIMPLQSNVMVLATGIGPRGANTDPGSAAIIQRDAGTDARDAATRAIAGKAANCA